MDRRAPEPIPATAADRRVLSAVLADAFSDDPVFTWLHPNDASRRNALRRFFGAELKVMTKADRVITTPDRGAAALWARPNHWKSSPWELLQMLPASLLMASHPRAAMSFFNKMEKAHPEEPHWYLATVGSDRAHRGQGHGQAVIQSVLDDCDAEGLPAYLESSKLENVPYYARFGFEPTGEITVADSPVLIPMWRTPR